jgi:prepilin-type N-terminal cleavage/methylation domain-containing protein
MRIKNEKGMTLLEIMIVLLIIAVIAGLIVAGIRIVQSVNRDTQRKAFTRDFQLLLEAYHDKKNRYPSTVSTSGTCASGEVKIAAMDGATEVESICTKINFDIYNSNETGGDSGCASYKSGGGMYDVEANSGDLHMCYDNTSQGYWLFVQLERDSVPYNASNIE